MYICLCQGVTDKDICHAIQTGQAKNLGDLSQKLGVGICCGQCGPEAKQLFEETISSKKSKKKRQ